MIIYDFADGKFIMQNPTVLFQLMQHYFIVQDRLDGDNIYWKCSKTQLPIKYPQTDPRIVVEILYENIKYIV